MPDLYWGMYTVFHCTPLFRSWHNHFHVPLWSVKISPLCPVPRYPICKSCLKNLQPNWQNRDISLMKVRQATNNNACIIMFEVYILSTQYKLDWCATPKQYCDTACWCVCRLYELYVIITEEARRVKRIMYSIGTTIYNTLCDPQRTQTNVRHQVFSLYDVRRVYSLM